MQLNCENCGASFEPGRISRKLRFAECAYCGTLHNIAEITAKHGGRECSTGRFPAQAHVGH